MTPIPYGRHFLDDEDIAAVVEVLKSDWLTTGPSVEAFERALSERLGCRAAVACASGTAALHLAHMALDIGPGDRVVVPSLTFTASAAAAHLTGADVTLADVDPQTGLLSPETFRQAAGVSAEMDPPRAVVAVHLNGQCVDLPALRAITSEIGCHIIEDACHAVGTSYGGPSEWWPVGACAHSDLACFSFHPVKTITSAEGGAVTAADKALGERLRLFRNHGIERGAERFVDPSGTSKPWYYETVALSTQYRLNDMQAALGRSQLKKLPELKRRRKELVELYDDLLAPFSPAIRPVAKMPGNQPAWHLYSTLIDFEAFKRSRADVMSAMKSRGIGTQVHYIPLHLQPYYRNRYGDMDLPGAAEYYSRQLSLPLYPGLRDSQVAQVVQALTETLGA